jgi:molybdopterin/thiamine biosynthesis adenylyltransferase
MKQVSIYDELFKRNIPLIDSQTQQKIKSLRVLVAGCGSTGGAFIEGASRLGVLNYRLAEPDHYELHNLNRQFVYPEDTGKNKGEVHAERLRKLLKDCGAQIEVHTDGIQKENVNQLLNGVDLVFDAVDVTTAEGISAKFLLHETAAARKLPVLSALDLGFKQWLRIFDYRDGAQALDGNLKKARAIENPIKALFEGICPASELPAEILHEILRVFKNPGSSFCQIASPCHLLAGFTAPILIRFAEGKSLPKLLYFDPMQELQNSDERASSENERLRLLKQVESLLASLK